MLIENFCISQEQWFCPGAKGASATGFIAERFRNVRLRNFSSTEKEELGIKRIKKETLKKVKIIGIEDTSVEFLQKQQWLKENSRPIEQVLRFMSETFDGRRYQIFENPESVIQSWPRLLDQYIVRNQYNLTILLITYILLS